MNIDILKVNVMKIDKSHTNIELINLLIGCDQGLKSYQINVVDKNIQEIPLNINVNENLGNVYDIHVTGGNAYIASNNGSTY